MQASKFQKMLAIASVTGILSGCGGGGGVSVGDTAAPSISSVSTGTPSNGQLTVTANATDNTGVTGYCFKTSPSAPLTSDACFQASPSSSITLPQTSAVYVWAKDAAGNISASASAGCSATGLSASQASALPTVCVSTSLGQFVLELESTKAPITTTNFLKYVNDGFYSQTVFHRVIANFMVQGGGFTGVPINITNAKTGTIYPAINLETPATTGLSNTLGTIAMARTNVLNSATSQFFINVVDNTALDTSGGGYAAFGRVISGMDTTIQSIRNVVVQSNGSEVSQPLTPPVVAWAYPLK
jgi:peptidyl-prolyl cis-trans isomerase A (cyclophilin A)